MNTQNIREPVTAIMNPEELEDVEAQNNTLAKGFKNIYTNYKYKMNEEDFKNLLRTGPRSLSVNSVDTYWRSLKLLSKKLGMYNQLIADVPVTSFEMAEKLLKDGAFAPMSNSIRKARVNALLIGLDPEKNNAASTKYDMKSLTYDEAKEAGELEEWKQGVYDKYVYGEFWNKYKGKYPTAGDYAEYKKLALNDALSAADKKKVEKWEAKKEDNLGPVMTSRLPGQDNSTHRDIANIVPQEMWSGERTFPITIYENKPMAMMIADLRSKAKAESAAYSASVAEKNPKEDKNWTSWKQIRIRAQTVRGELKTALQAKGLEMPTVTSIKQYVKVGVEGWEKAMAEKNKPATNAIRGLVKSQMVSLYFKKYAEKFNKPMMAKLMNAFIATLYTAMPPRRLDWAKVTVLSSKKFKKLEAKEGDANNGGVDDGIYILTNEMGTPAAVKIYFGARAGKSREEEGWTATIKKSEFVILLMMLRNILLEKGHKPTAQGLRLIVSNPGYKDIDENALGKRVKKIFSGNYVKQGVITGGEKKITSGLLRKIYISSQFEGDAGKKRDLAKFMNHSVKVQQHIYNKDTSGAQLLKLESNQIPVEAWMTQ